MSGETELDLKDLQTLLEALQRRLNKMALTTKVDVAARLRAVSKCADAIDKEVKAAVKEKLNGKPGTVPGDLFKANLAYIPTTRLNQQRLKEEYPKIYDRFCETTGVARITFEVR